jgi:pimeloyl-ACP methyl ester carboxylesterase
MAAAVEPRTAPPAADVERIAILAGGNSYRLALRGARNPRPRLVKGVEPRPLTTITTDVETLYELEAGASGLEAFLAGRLAVRGNLALSLRLDAMWAGTEAKRHLKAGTAGAAGVATSYLEAGPADAPAVVLLHGLGATNASFLPTFWELARTRHVIAPDLPGHGDSSKPIRPYHAGFFARWLAALLDALQIERADLVGNSLGGRIALEAGYRHPQRIRRIVLLAPALAFLRHRQYVAIVRLLRPELAAVPLLITHGRVVAGLRALFARPSRLRPEWYAAAADEFLRIFRQPRGRIAFFSALRQIYMDEPHGPRGVWARLPSLQVPALFVWGDRDWLVPARFAAHVERRLPGARSVVLRDCGHVPQYELPSRTNELVEAFLENQV